ncbi:MAG: hypothetical protein EPN22_08990 [Nitrospirae bacterium]|nr:MAG: hypothetical protein EPN22_08990 [Nitrospirota bacterium]
MKVTAELHSQAYLANLAAGKGLLPSGKSELRSAQNARIESLETIQRTVVNHELAHMAPGSAHNATASYEYMKGPDGTNFIIAGGVSIDMGTSGPPEKVIDDMEKVKRAALSPANPSFQDFVVAGRAIAIANYEKSQKAIKEFLETPVNESQTLSVFS